MREHTFKSYMNLIPIEKEGKIANGRFASPETFSLKLSFTIYMYLQAILHIIVVKV